MKRAFAVVALVVVACKDSSPITVAIPSGAGGAYVSAVIDTMQANSIRRTTIDWTNLRSQVFATVPPGGSVADSYTAIFLALELLGDNHSSYEAVNGATLFASTLDCTAPIIQSAPSLGTDIGYVRVGGFLGTTVQAQAFTDSITAAIRAVDSPQVHGWIVDLRGNGGGYMYPMVAGLGPILGTGVAGYFVNSYGAATPWGYDGRESYYGTTPKQGVTTPYTLIASFSPPVAVLIDRGVASSGEATAISFKQRQNTRFFGTGTCGLSTAPVGFPLSDGATLTLATATDADRTSHLYGGPILPDTVITDTSAVVPAAIAWLRSPHP
jgi:hypothetical protein